MPSIFRCIQGMHRVLLWFLDNYFDEIAGVNRFISAAMMCACNYMRKIFWLRIHIFTFMGLLLVVLFLKENILFSFIGWLLYLVFDYPLIVFYFLSKCSSQLDITLCAWCSYLRLISSICFRLGFFRVQAANFNAVQLAIVAVFSQLAQIPQGTLYHIIIWSLLSSCCLAGALWMARSDCTSRRWEHWLCITKQNSSWNR